MMGRLLGLQGRRLVPGIQTVQSGVPRSSGVDAQTTGATWAADRAPVLVFAVVYVVTCLIGALLMLAGFQDFNQLFEYFSGTRVAHLTPAQGLIDLVLLIGAPAALWLGYELALRIRLNRAGTRPLADTSDRLAAGPLQAPSWLPFLVFYGLALLAAVSIAHAGSLGSIDSWLNYHSWIAARQRAFAHMAFFQFVNIYLLVPIAAAWIVITYRKPGIQGWIIRWMPLAVTLIIDFLLFQKKTAIVSFLIVMFAWFLVQSRHQGRRVKTAAILVFLIVAIVYLATVVVPVYSQASNASICSLRGVSCHGAAAAVPAVVAYTALSPLTRGSAPALYYPIIFPHHHAYFSFGSIFALDILGIGTFPNDNQVVWHWLNPTAPGTTMVPFQFTLYSQGGLAVALVGSFLVGLLLALAWRFVRCGMLPREWSSLLGSMVLLLGVYLALDSLRNSTLVSYGMIWGVLFIALAAIVVRFGNGGPAHLGPDVRLARQSRRWKLGSGGARAELSPPGQP